MQAAVSGAAGHRYHHLTLIFIQLQTPSADINMNILIFTTILNQKQRVLFPELHIITSQIVVLVDTDLHCTFK
jgi:hypothetical protein